MAAPQKRRHLSTAGSPTINERRDSGDPYDPNNGMYLCGPVRHLLGGRH
jgi:hypothetical protein